MDLRELEYNIKIEQNKLDNAEKLERLYTNKDFQDIILTKFMKTQVLQSVYNKNMVNSTDLKELENINISVNALHNFFNIIMQSKETAKDNLEELNKLKYKG